jgi:hypothetical protein
MDAAELRRLTAARPLVTRELHPFNAFYGHDRLLKRYAGIPEREVLKLSIEHGLPLSRTVGALDRKLALPLHLCQAPARAQLVERELPAVDAVPIGALIHYAEDVAEERRSRVLLFPAHSVQTGRAEYDVDSFVHATQSYREQFAETAVCLYWRDVQFGRDADYRRHGLDVVSAGHIYDPAFVPRLRTLLSSSRAVVTNEIGTHVVYAALLGCAVWIVPQQVGYRYDSGTAADELAAAASLRTDPPDEVPRLQAAFADPNVSLDAEQRALVAEVTGEAQVKSPLELRALIARAESEYVSRTTRAQRLSQRAASAARRWRSHVDAARQGS